MRIAQPQTLCSWESPTAHGANKTLNSSFRLTARPKELNSLQSTRITVFLKRLRRPKGRSAAGVSEPERHRTEREAANRPLSFISTGAAAKLLINDEFASPPIPLFAWGNRRRGAGAAYMGYSSFKWVIRKSGTRSPGDRS